MLLLEKYFDVAFAAPDGVKNLRELILSLAMQGKLVPQDPSDQSARELLKEIEAEKSRLVKDGKIKASKPLPEIKPDEVPYDLPKSWEWVRLGEIATQITDGVHQTPKYLDTGIPFISIKDINGKTVSFNDCKYISQEEHQQINLRCNPERGDILICRIGTLGRATIVDTDRCFSLFVSVGLLKFPQHLIIPIFTHRTLSSPFLIRQYDQIKAGGSHTNKLNLGDIPRLIFPLPPLAEQRRIVAKIDELMARCDELEKLRQVHAQKQITVHNAALNQLLTAKDHNDFKTSWHFISQHFGELYSVKANVAELRKAILQLAVMGKLVPQNPNDQPASELLNAIEVEKNRLVKEGKIKRESKIPLLLEKEIPFNVPKSWQWTRLGLVMERLTDYHANGSYEILKKHVELLDEPDFAIMLRTTNFSEKSREKYKYITKEAYEYLEKSKVFAGDIIMNKIADPGATFYVDDRGKPMSLAMNLFLLKFNPKNMLSKFVYFYLAGNYDYVVSFSSGTATPTITKDAVKSLRFPLPPLAEQHRIVAKIDQLMTLCDELEKQIDIANSKKTNLLNSVMTKV
ncbi:restriction endonuclease subunit S [Pseudanabaena sp. FACHB-1050]|uniref:Restriction endonuclease subunit S n=1 Tax=Phormidium tenue FACHB-1050 TaxID=2692857 RepID=A0ABR8C8Y3_9CYAN|nr:restriction endonuclease subunit S [Phormidium tenue FACHB-1050]